MLQLFPFHTREPQPSPRLCSGDEGFASPLRGPALGVSRAHPLCSFRPHQTVCLSLYHRVHLELATYAHICSPVGPSYLPSFLGFFLPLGSLAA